MYSIFAKSMRYTVSFVGGFSLVGFLVLVAIGIMRYDEWTLKELSELITGLVVILTLGFAITQFAFTTDWHRRKAVLTEVTKITSQISRVRRLLASKGVPLDDFIDRKSIVRPTDIESWDERFPATKPMLIMIINSLEEIALGVRNGIYSEPMTRMLAETMIDRYWYCLQELVTAERRASDWASFGVELEALCREWSLLRNPVKRSDGSKAT